MPFYVDLLCFVSTNYFSNNTLWHFQSYLPVQVNLNQDLEFSLTEIYHPNYSENVTNGVFFSGAYEEEV